MVLNKKNIFNSSGPVELVDLGTVYRLFAEKLSPSQPMETPTHDMQAPTIFNGRLWDEDG